MYLRYMEKKGNIVFGIFWNLLTIHGCLLIDMSSNIVLYANVALTHNREYFASKFRMFYEYKILFEI